METSIENGATQSFLKIAQIVHEMDISFYSVLLLLQSGRIGVQFLSVLEISTTQTELLFNEKQ